MNRKDLESFRFGRGGIGGLVLVGSEHFHRPCNASILVLKRGIVGTWHRISAKHLEAYLNEMTFRFNNRSNPYLFRDTLIKLIEAPVLEYKKLTAA